MAVFFAPLPEGFDAPPQSFMGRLSFDDPISSSRLGPIMGEPQKVKRSILGVRRPILGWLTKLDQLRLVWMNGQSITAKPFG